MHGRGEVEERRTAETRELRPKEAAASAERDELHVSGTLIIVFSV